MSRALACTLIFSVLEAVVPLLACTLIFSMLEAVVPLELLFRVSVLELSVISSSSCRSEVRVSI